MDSEACTDTEDDDTRRSNTEDEDTRRSNTEDDDTKISNKQGRNFSVAQTAHLKSMFKSGMTSASKRHRPLLEKAAADTGLTIQQVVVCVLG